MSQQAQKEWMLSPGEIAGHAAGGAAVGAVGGPVGAVIGASGAVLGGAVSKIVKHAVEPKPAGTSAQAKPKAEVKFGQAKGK